MQRNSRAVVYSLLVQSHMILMNMLRYFLTVFPALIEVLGGLSVRQYLGSVGKSTS